MFQLTTASFLWLCELFFLRGQDEGREIFVLDFTHHTLPVDRRNQPGLSSNGIDQALYIVPRLHT